MSSQLIRMMSCKESLIIFFLVFVFSRNINGSIAPLSIFSEDTGDLNNYPFLLILRGRTSRRLYREYKTLKRSHTPTLDDVSLVSWHF